MLPKMSENCPFCGKKMERGYVISGTGIYWDKEERKLTISGAQLLVGGRTRWTFANAEAYRCRNCQIAVFYYGKGESKEKSNGGSAAGSYR